MRRILFLLAAAVLVISCVSASAATLTWYGQSFFTVTSKSGATVAFDPYHTGNGINYKPPTVTAGAVFVSHNHFDHNNVDLVKGSDKTIILPISKGTRSATLVIGKEKIPYKSVFSYHDPVLGKERGTNTINIVTVDGVRICHLGDLGTDLTTDQIKEIGQVDILLIPVGGVYTIDYRGANTVYAQLRPKVAIPMHYKTPGISIPLSGVEPFIKGKNNVDYGGDTFSFTKAALPKQPRIHVMKYKG